MSTPEPAAPRPLLRAALELERHVAARGWDRGPALFALVPTSALMASEPGLADHLEAAGDPAGPDDLSAVEQEGLPATDTLEDLLGRLAWPPEVAGVALTVERLVVPPEAERDLPADPDEAARALAAHPDAAEIRLVVAVTRPPSPDGSAAAAQAGDQVCLLRQRAHDSDDAVAVGRDIAPGLVAALAATLED
ncbi:PPA1309 family protein [Agilicoccus flavus]|uniref:PPA1309 family protein n=1 Tax=Agilicoccus flavus TaxID=2775968 RepID=UPI001CF6DE41|nr:PPA1309 family protein [Agilicoccus flavus]